MSLYYYTTTETMSFILKKGDIFATNISYLNDSQEYINGLKELRELLCGDKAGEYAESARNHLAGADAYRDALKEAHDIYSISFSQEKDLLSQWYMYAKESGVRLKMDIADDYELEVKVLGKEEEDKEPNLHLRSKCKKVHYYTRIGMEEDEYKRESEEIIEGINQYVKEKSMGDLDTYISAIWSGYAPYIKNYEFRQEKEVRLIFHGLSAEGKNPLVHYRNAKGVLVPYMDIYLESGWPVTEIMVGPGRNQHNVYTSICHFVENTDGIKVADIDEEQSMDDFVKGLGQYKILEQDCEEILEGVRRECSDISNRKDVLYEVLERYMNKEKDNEKKVLLVQEYLARNTYTSKKIIVRKSNVPYEF